MTAAEKVAQLLRRRIALGGLPPGSKLPTERELAQALDVSRNTIREAIRELGRDGVVETTLGRGGGTRVLDPQRLSTREDRAAIASEFRDLIRNQMEYRLLIEPEAAGLAAERGSTEERRKLVELLAADVPDLLAYHQVDTGFHVGVARASGNPVLREAVVNARADLFVGGNALWLHTDWGTVYAAGVAPGEVFRAEHAAIAAAIMAGDRASATRFMREHLEESRDQFERLILKLSE